MSPEPGGEAGTRLQGRLIPCFYRPAEPPSLSSRDRIAGRGEWYGRAVTARRAIAFSIQL